jgi:hypothetical protein
VEDGYVRKLINQPLELVRPVVHDWRAARVRWLLEMHY